MFYAILTLVLAFVPIFTDAGLITYGICQTGCNTVAVACYSIFGFTFGTVTAGAGVPLVILGCNSMLGMCMMGCIALGFTPTP